MGDVPAGRVLDWAAKFFDCWRARAATICDTAAPYRPRSAAWWILQQRFMLR
jgi:hypothetical protein